MNYAEELQKLCEEKLFALEKARLLETDITRKLKLDDEIKEAKAQCSNLKENYPHFDWNAAIENYKQSLLDTYGKIRLLGSQNSVDLEGIFTDVYILNKVSAFERYAIEDLTKDITIVCRDAERHNGFELVKSERFKSLFVLGKPGAGKTTFLKYLTIQACKGLLKQLPIFISLHGWINFVKKTGQFELMPFLIKQFELCHFPEAKLFVESLLKKGEALVLFDGLDEVNQAQEERIKTINLLKEFCQQNSKCTILLTCRVAAADYSLTEQFKYLEVSDFTDAQIECFVRKWFVEDNERAEKFITEFKQHKGLKELARIPILLTLLCLIYQRKMEFPERRADIYEEAIEALIEKWDTEHRGIKRDVIYQGLAKRQKIQLFSRIAFETFNAKIYFFEKKFLIKKIEDFLNQLANPNNQIIDGEVVLEAIAEQHGIFVERAKDIYSFAHLSFQEYFTAKYYAENQTQLNALAQQVTEDRWREVFLLTASLLDNADTLFAAMQHQLDVLMSSETELFKLTQWVNKKADAICSKNYTAVEVKVFYYFLALALARDLDLDLALDLAFDLDLARALALARDLALARALARALTDDNLKVDYLLYISCLITMQLTLLKLDDFNKNQVKEVREEFPSFFNDIIQQAQLFPSLQIQLRHLQNHLPKPEDEQQSWKNFAEKLLTIMQTERNIGHQWNLNKEQINKMERYFYGHQLIIDCLKLAAVSNRTEIENQLLRVPPKTTLLNKLLSFLRKP